MEADNGPISITALLAASSQQPISQTQPIVHQPPPSLPPRPPQQNNNISIQPPQPQRIIEQKIQPQQQQYQQQHQQYHQQQQQLQQLQLLQQEKYQYQPQYYNQQIALKQYEQIPQNLQQIPIELSPPMQMITQLPNGHHILSHHNPLVSPPPIQSQLHSRPIVRRQQFYQNPQQFYPISNQRTPQTNQVIEQKVSQSRPGSVIPSHFPVTTIVAKPQKPQTPMRNFSSSAVIPKTNSRIKQNPQYFIDQNDKLFSKVQQMQNQIDKLSRAIIKKDNQELHTQLNLNQVIQQKDRVLQKKNRQLQASTKRIKQLIEETERKDLQIQRLKLQIQRANRINNMSVSLSKIDELEIRNDAENIMTSAYFKDLIQQSHDFRNTKPRMIPTRQPSSNTRIQNIQQGFLSPTSVDLRYAKPAGEANIYKPSGQRNYY